MGMDKSERPTWSSRSSCERAAPVNNLLAFQKLLPLKSVEASEAAAKDQGVDFVRALIGVDRL